MASEAVLYFTDRASKPFTVEMPWAGDDPDKPHRVRGAWFNRDVAKRLAAGELLQEIEDKRGSAGPARLKAVCREIAKKGHPIRLLLPGAPGTKRGIASPPAGALELVGLEGDGAAWRLEGELYVSMNGGSPASPPESEATADGEHYIDRCPPIPAVVEPGRLVIASSDGYFRASWRDENGLVVSSFGITSSPGLERVVSEHRAVGRRLRWQGPDPCPESVLLALKMADGLKPADQELKEAPPKAEPGKARLPIQLGHLTPGEVVCIEPEGDEYALVYRPGASPHEERSVIRAAILEPIGDWHRHPPWDRLRFAPDLFPEKYEKAPAECAWCRMREATSTYGDDELPICESCLASVYPGGHRGGITVPPSEPAMLCACGASATTKWGAHGIHACAPCAERETAKIAERETAKNLGLLVEQRRKERRAWEARREAGKLEEGEREPPIISVERELEEVIREIRRYVFEHNGESPPKGHDLLRRRDELETIAKAELDELAREYQETEAKIALISARQRTLAARKKELGKRTGFIRAVIARRFDAWGWGKTYVSDEIALTPITASPKIKAVDIERIPPDWLLDESLFRPCNREPADLYAPQYAKIAERVNAELDLERQRLEDERREQALEAGVSPWDAELEALEARELVEPPSFVEGFRLVPGVQIPR